MAGTRLRESDFTDAVKWMRRRHARADRLSTKRPSRDGLGNKVAVPPLGFEVAMLMLEPLKASGPLDRKEPQ